ncbi:Capsid-associated protein Vp91 [Orchesella cincta]|uniref:Capsid-associated protein Vp91 n=1 Tax=Orchesella cincta TaxID=48709 RepID=A0A1D2NG17_ORCCI|nr:Capsid-associated protein Vp91 [Orchesella cincta]
MSGQRKLSVKDSIVLCLIITIQIQLALCEIPSRTYTASEVDSLLKQLEEEGQGQIVKVAHEVKSRNTEKHWRTMPVPTFIECTSQGRIAIPRECSKFFLCPADGVESTTEYCPENHHFHHQKRACLEITFEECKESMCKDPTDKFPHSYAKEKYLSCEKMYPEVKSCKEGEIFDNIAQYCVTGSPTDNLKSSAEEDNSNEKFAAGPEEES